LIRLGWEVGRLGSWEAGRLGGWKAGRGKTVGAWLTAHGSER